MTFWTPGSLLTFRVMLAWQAAQVMPVMLNFWVCIGDHLFLYYYPYFCGGKLANELVWDIGAFGTWDTVRTGIFGKPGGAFIHLAAVAL